MKGSPEDEPPAPAVAMDHRPGHRSISIAVSASQDQRPILGVPSARRLFTSGTLSSGSPKAESQAALQTTPLRSGIQTNIECSTWPFARERDKITCFRSLHPMADAEADGKRALKQSESASSERQSSNATRQRALKFAMDTHDSRASNRTVERRVLQVAESKRTDFGYGHAREKPLVLNTPMREQRSEIGDVRAKLARLAADQSRPKPFPPGSQITWKSRCRSPERDETNEIDKNPLADAGKLQLEEDLGKLDSKLGSQFERLLTAIDGVTKQVQTAFEGLHERVDSLQRSLEADYDSGWKSLKDHLDQQGIVAGDVWKRGSLMRSPSAASLHPLQEATEMAREDIRILTGLLIVEKDADLMLARDFQDRQVMLLRMMRSHLKKPVFEQFWHMKLGLDHCVASVLFKTSHILARTQSVMGSGSASKASAEEHDEAHFNRFCKKGVKGLETFAEREEEKWSGHLKSEFLSACKSVWQLQSKVAASMPFHQVEILDPNPGSKLDELTMDPLDCLSGDHFQPVVQFTVFPGFKFDGSVLIKPQVYLQPKRMVVTGV